MPLAAQAPGLPLLSSVNHQPHIDEAERPRPPFQDTGHFYCLKLPLNHEQNPLSRRLWGWHAVGRKSPISCW